VDALTGNAAALNAVQQGAAAYGDKMEHLNSVQDANGEITAGTIGQYEQQKIASDALLDSLNGQATANQQEISAQQALQEAIAGSSNAAQDNATRLQGLANAASAGNTAISLLKGALDALTGTAVSLGDAQVAVTQATETALHALDGQKDAAGNLTSALTDANGHLDQTTAAGAAAWSSLTQLSSADNTLIATMEQHGATADEVNKKDGELRDSFINTAMQMGFSADEATNLANQIYGIPSERKTEIDTDTAAATQKVADFQAAMAAIHDKSVKITTYLETAVRDSSATSATVNAAFRSIEARGGAIGGIVHKFADGGFQPMQGGIAQIVEPNTWRVIGDRVTDDEAYIPINSSARSLAILAQTAGRMGYGLADRSTPAAGKTDARSYQFNISAPSDPRAIASQIRGVQADLEFLHG
jgi:hypothetical protein